MGLFRLFFAGFFLLIYVYITHQLLIGTELGTWGSAGVMLFLGLVFALVLAMPLYLMEETKNDHKAWHDSLLRASHFALAYINFLGSLVILRDLLTLIESFFSNLPWWLQQEVAYGRTALGLLLFLPLGMILCGTLVVRVGPRLIKVDIESEHVPTMWDGVRILHITDLHIGSSLPAHFVEKLVKQAREIRPDLVVYTGDILDGKPIRHLPEIEMLKNIQAPLGSFYVTGNHEYYWRGDQALAAFKAVGFHTLTNDVITLRRGSDALQIAGIPDPAARGFSLPGPDFALVEKSLMTDSFRILLSHQPSLIAESEKIKIHLQLSGHTHGGQFFPWNFLIGFFQKYPKGLYKVGSSALYVSQGTGYWGPSLRMGTFCEITEITLRKK